MNEEWVVNYIDEKFDEKLFFFSTKEEAEIKFNEIKDNEKYSYKKLMTRSEYDEFEMEIMDMIDCTEDEDVE